jgi:hypothetical protein
MKKQYVTLNYKKLEGTKEDVIVLKEKIKKYVREYKKNDEYIVGASAIKDIIHELYEDDWPNSRERSVRSLIENMESILHRLRTNRNVNPELKLPVNPTLFWDEDSW